MKKYLITILKNKNILSLFLSVILFLIIYLISLFWAFYNLDKSIQNNYFGIKNKITWTKAHKSIVVVEIDEKTLEKLWWFPFTRDTYSPFLANLSDAWVAVVWFDIIFVDKKDEKLDFKFALSIEDSNNVVLWAPILKTWNIKYPLEIFSKNTKWIWYFSPNVDVNNLVVYTFKPFSKFKNTDYLDHFWLSILKAFYSHIYSKNFNDFRSYLKDSYYFLTDDIKIPLSRTNKNEVLINYIDNKQFKKISFVDIYDKKTFNEIKKTTDFKDKIVIVWFAVKGKKDDVFYTPNGVEYWVYIHANIVNTVLNKSYLVYFNKTLEWFLVFLLIILSVYFNLSRSQAVLIFSNISIASIFLIIFPVLILVFTNLIINFPLELLFALVLSLTSSNIVKYLIENKHKQRLNKALSEYVSSDIASEILSWDWKLNLNWEKKEVAVFFSDIQGFTTISEKLSPEELVSFLKEYLGSMSTIIMEERGFIDKYEWDAVMAVWWAFWEKWNYCYQACNSALIQGKALRLLNKKFEQSVWAKIKVRVWINFWEAILWNIWAVWKKMEFTALWDNVNLASRLEWVNKFYGTYLCVSESVYERVKDDFEFRFLDKIKVKWKEVDVCIYELLDYKDGLNEVQKSIVTNFEKALDLYFKKKFKESLKIFEKLVLDWDIPSKTFVLRCKNFIVNPPSSTWDWVWKMEEK